MKKSVAIVINMLFAHGRASSLLSRADEKSAAAQGFSDLSDSLERERRSL